jgi:hypothetical protein
MSTELTKLDNQYSLDKDSGMIISTEDSVDNFPLCFSYSSVISFLSPSDFFHKNPPITCSKKYNNIYFFEYYDAPILLILNKLKESLSLCGHILIPVNIANKYAYIRSLAKRLGYTHEKNYSLTQSYLILCNEKLPQWKLTISTSNDLESICDLFLHVFQHGLSVEMWNWKYSQGRGVAILGHKEGSLVAHYGGMSRNIMIASRPSFALQIGDVMVKNSERGLLTRNGLFFQMCATFLEQYIGDGKPYQLGFGFPTRRAMEVAKRQKLYQQVDHMVEKQWSPLDIRPSFFSTVKYLEKNTNQRTHTKVNMLWKRMLKDLNQSIIGVRDWDYIVQRYFEHPEKKYHVYLINSRIVSKPIGVIILSIEQSRCRLLETIGPVQSFPTLIHHARRLTNALGAQQLFGWLSNSHQKYWDSGKEQPLDICIPTNVWTESSNVNQAKLAWWLTAGDTDFC